MFAHRRHAVRECLVDVHMTRRTRATAAAQGLDICGPGIANGLHQGLTLVALDFLFFTLTRNDGDAWHYEFPARSMDNIRR